MGEISDSIIDGEMCQGCGEYLGDAVGYPRYCSSCNPDRKFHKKPKASVGYTAVKGVTNFLSKNHVKEENHSMILGDYSMELELNFNIIDVDQVVMTCEEIQKDFTKFVKWFRKNYQ